MSRERPILFSAPMVRALLDGRKTQTRRLLKPQPPSEAATRSTPYSIGPAVARGTGIYSLNDHDRMPKEPGVFDAYGSVGVVRAACGQTTWTCPYGVPGDRLWVREAWQLLRCSPIPDCDGGGWEFDGEYEGPIPKVKPEPYSGLDLAYAATHALDETRWRPSIHMPRWASRLTLEITNVRLERLHDISDADAWAEGVQVPAGSTTRYQGEGRELFFDLWRTINGEASLDTNPYVWVVEFKAVTV